VAFYCTDLDELEVRLTSYFPLRFISLIIEQDGAFSYSHRLRPGVNRVSHGLKVAQLARMPPSAIKMASAALEHLIGEDNTTMLARGAELRALGKRLAQMA